MPNSVVTYRSFAVSLFDSWRILFYGSMVLTLFLGILFGNLGLGLKLAIVLSVIAVMIQFGASHSEVSYDGRSIYLSDANKQFKLADYQKYTRFWSYDFGISSIQFSEGTQGKTRALTNKINNYIKFEGADDVVYIYEQNHMRDKFPSGVAYVGEVDIQPSKLFKVWDVDNCLAKLGLEMEE